MAKLVEGMEQKLQWAGETHIQKALYFLHSMLNVPCLYNFVLYKHGPYSFDLHDDLGKMRAHLVLEIEPRRPYGPSFRLGQLAACLSKTIYVITYTLTMQAVGIRGYSDRLLGENSILKVEESVSRYFSQIGFVVENLGGMDVRILERYATALYVKRDKKESDPKSLGKAIVARKPHISEDDAQKAVKWVNDLEEQSKSQGLIFEQ